MSAVARVRIEVEVVVGSWSESATFAETKDQVKREGIQIVCGALKGKGRIIGDPTCSFVMVDEKE